MLNNSRNSTFRPASGIITIPKPLTDKKINLKDHEIKKIAPRYISKKQADRIKNFAKYDYKEKLELEKKKKKKATAENNVTKTSKNAKQKEARK